VEIKKEPQGPVVLFK